jgi:hypothetical protein
MARLVVDGPLAAFPTDARESAITRVFQMIVRGL